MTIAPQSLFNHLINNSISLGLNLSSLRVLPSFRRGKQIVSNDSEKLDKEYRDSEYETAGFDFMWLVNTAADC